MKKHFVDEMYRVVRRMENKTMCKKEAMRALTFLFRSPSFLSFKKHTLAHVRQYVYLFLSEYGFTVEEIAEALNVSERLIYKYKRIFS